ncbi:hypothetical protein B0H16DRAFT_1685412 [Mycena metata]|uniref:Uncharacterized protein n=1 Tax=Mycena metata TaxID=1033252 RepID=A0AAD7NS00_9AGAR|nr:hypothetical protein B0H16DRAFT_1685412 [Mycena metata]
MDRTRLVQQRAAGQLHAKFNIVVGLVIDVRTGARGSEVMARERERERQMGRGRREREEGNANGNQNTHHVSSHSIPFPSSSFSISLNAAREDTVGAKGYGWRGQRSRRGGCREGGSEREGLSFRALDVGSTWWSAIAAAGTGETKGWALGQGGRVVAAATGGTGSLWGGFPLSSGCWRQRLTAAFGRGQRRAVETWIVGHVATESRQRKGRD